MSKEETDLFSSKEHLCDLPTTEYPATAPEAPRPFGKSCNSPAARMPSPQVQGGS